ncbi:2081_t:CDS:1, partial [Cetraspora pellucida]
LVDYTFSEQFKMLTNLLYKKHHEFDSLELDHNLFQQMIEAADLRLKGFFNQMVEMLIPNNKTIYNKTEAKKSVVSLCYIMAGMRNKFVNDFKLEVRLYLLASGTSRTAIDTMHSIGFSSCYQTVNNYMRKIANEHSRKIREYFSEYVSLNFENFETSPIEKGPHSLCI